MTDEWVDELFAHTELYMAFLKAHLKKLTTGPVAVPPPAVPVNSVVPGLSGNAVTGDTLTASHGTWSGSPTAYDQQWQSADAPLFDQWTNISGEIALAHICLVGEEGKKLRYGERALNLGGWSEWAYSNPTGIVAASAPSLPTINTPGSISPTSGLDVGETITITAPSMTGATSWWVTLVKDGQINEAVATDQDVFPFSYILQAQDTCTTFALRTFASNAAGTVTADSSDVGPVSLGSGTAIIDLGSCDATATFIESGFSSNWALSGTATQTQTVSSAAELKALWDSSIKGAAKTERWDITLDWNGLSTYGTETTPILIDAPSGAGWSDNGGWVRLKAASGKRPAFANCIEARNWRGVHLEGLDLFGRHSNPSSNTAGLIYLNRSFGECVLTGHDLRFGRFCINPSEASTDMMRAIATGGKTHEQLTFDKVLIAGSFVVMHGTWRRMKWTNSDIRTTIEDMFKCYTHDRSGFYGYYWLENITFREALDIPATRSYHADVLQFGNLSDLHLGCRLLMRNVVAHVDHKYGNVNGTDGGSQGIQIGNDSDVDHLLAFKNVILLHTSPNSLQVYSPGATYTSYWENVTCMRAGISSSGFDGYPDQKDNSPGLNLGPTPLKSGVAFKFKNALACRDGSAQFGGTLPSWVNVDAASVMNVDPRISPATGAPTPETVFNGRDFERGGVNTANSIANKFGYIMPNEGGTQAQFLADIFANFTPQGAFSGKGCPELDPVNFTAPVLG